MNDHQPQGMREALRLVQAGKLGDATALLQGVLGGHAPSQERGGGSPKTIDGTAETVDVSPPPNTREKVKQTVTSVVPDVLRGLLDRLRKDGSAPRTGDGRSDPAPDGSRFVSGTFSNDAGSRTYKLFIPSGHHGQPVPLVVMLHGCTQSPDDFAAGTGMNAMAEEHNCLVVYPAQPASANASKCWNWFLPKDQARDRGEPSLIAGITRQVMREHTVDPRRVYVAGLSAGGAAAAIMGHAYPDLYAAVGVHSGLPPGAASDVTSAFAAMRQGASGPDGASRPGITPPTIVFHGSQDGTVHRRNGDQVATLAVGSAGLRASAERGEANGRGYTRTLHADGAGRPVVEHWLIHQGGHAWSGGSAAGSYADPTGPDASREMLRFFMAHRSPASA